jgi:hypothetical protein
MRRSPDSLRSRRPSTRSLAALAASAALLALASCAGDRAPGGEIAVHELTPRFLAKSVARHAALAADAHGRVALTYVTDSANGLDLWLAVSSDSGETFAAPQRLNDRPGSVRSEPESRPIAAFGEGGRLAVAWSEVSGDPALSLATNLIVRASGDGGTTFAPAARVNDDYRLPPCSHEFPALAFRDDGSLIAAWLDERNNKTWDEARISTSLVTSVSRDGGLTWSPNWLVSSRACPCCRPALASAGAGNVAIAYRTAIVTGRARWSWKPNPPGEEPLHDPALAQSSDGGFTFTTDTLVSADGWRLDGCPAVGPSLTASSEDGGSYAWLTRAGGRSEVFVAPWRAPQGLAGVKRAAVDGVSDATHPRLVSAGGSTLLAVDGRSASDTTRSVIAVRALESDGSLSPWTLFGANARDGWIAAQDAHSSLVVWSELDRNSSRIRLARMTRP